MLLFYLLLSSRVNNFFVSIYFLHRKTCQAKIASHALEVICSNIFTVCSIIRSGNIEGKKIEVCTFIGSDSEPLLFRIGSEFSWGLDPDNFNPDP